MLLFELPLVAFRLPLIAPLELLPLPDMPVDELLLPFAPEFPVLEFPVLEFPVLEFPEPELPVLEPPFDGLIDEPEGERASLLMLPVPLVPPVLPELPVPLVLPDPLLPLEPFVPPEVAPPVVPAGPGWPVVPVAPDWPEVPDVPEEPDELPLPVVPDVPDDCAIDKPKAVARTVPAQAAVR